MAKQKLKLNLSDTDIAYLDGLFDPFDDLPDGAWQAACEDAVATDSKFRGQDPYEVWMGWVKATSSRS